MIDLWIEVSGENVPLAVAEATAAAEALGGGAADPGADPPGGVGVMVQVPSASDGIAITGRLALAYRSVLPLPPRSRTAGARWVRSAAGPGARAAFRPVGRPTSAPIELVHALAAAWTEGGGTIDLRQPERRFWFAGDGDPALWLGEEMAAVDRHDRRGRRMPQLPFQRPVSLPPALGRVAANLARIRPGDRVVDPFLGTGALLAEAALLGAKVSGGDQEDAMVRGAMTNFAHLGLTFERVKVVDAGIPFPPPGGGRWDSIVTDPPYGRSSGTRGEPPEGLLCRSLSAWAEMVRPGGWLSLVAPSTAPADLGPRWSLLSTYPDRVHRSLTREFRTYRRTGSSSIS